MQRASVIEQGITPRTAGSTRAYGELPTSVNTDFLGGDGAVGDLEARMAMDSVGLAWAVDKTGLATYYAGRGLAIRTRRGTVRIHSVRLQNFGPFAMLEEARLGPLATIVGQNDVGKSCILRALGIFMNEKPKMEEVYVHKGAEPNADVVIEVAFTELPATVELEEGVPTTFAEEKLTDEQGYLRIRKVYPRTSLAKPRTELLVHSFLEDTYRALPVLKEEKLNSVAQAAGIDVKKSGAGITVNRHPKLTHHRRPILTHPA
jgi:hypothetical protein